MIFNHQIYILTQIHRSVGSQRVTHYLKCRGISHPAGTTATVCSSQTKPLWPKDPPSLRLSAWRKREGEGNCASLHSSNTARQTTSQSGWVTGRDHPSKTKTGSDRAWRKRTPGTQLSTPQWPAMPRHSDPDGIILLFFWMAALSLQELRELRPGVCHLLFSPSPAWAGAFW